MTNDMSSAHEQHGGPSPNSALVLHLGGPKGALNNFIVAAASGLFTAGLIGAIANGKYLWITIPVAIIFVFVFLSAFIGLRRSTTRHTIILDRHGIRTTLRGEPSAAVSWDEVAAVGMSYEICRSGESGNRQYRGLYYLDVFCSSPQQNTKDTINDVSLPKLVSDNTGPTYGTPEGHLRFGLGSPLKKRRAQITKQLENTAGDRLIEEFERPREYG